MTTLEKKIPKVAHSWKVEEMTKTKWVSGRNKVAYAKMARRTTTKMLRRGLGLEEGGKHRHGADTVPCNPTACDDLSPLVLGTRLDRHCLRRRMSDPKVQIEQES